MTPSDIAALPKGRDLDEHVERLVFGKDPKPSTPRYSTTNHALAILGLNLPFGVGRANRQDAFYNEAKPYFAEDRTPTVKGQFPLRVIASTPEVALCKLACIYKIMNAEGEKPATPPTA